MVHRLLFSPRSSTPSPPNKRLVGALYIFPMNSMLLAHDDPSPANFCRIATTLSIVTRRHSLLFVAAGRGVCDAFRFGLFNIILVAYMLRLRVMRLISHLKIITALFGRQARRRLRFEIQILNSFRTSALVPPTHQDNDTSI